jgi:PAS domain S-box-containing protein
MFNKRNEEARAYLAAIVESSDDAIISKDLNGIIKTWNKGAERLFGYTAEEARGKSIKIIIPPHLFAEEDQILRKIRSGERIEHYETMRCDKRGKEIDISLTISPLKDRKGRVIGASKIARDISEHKRLEKTLKEMNERKDEFLAVLSHELRNPLTAIHSGFALLHRTNYDPATIRQTLEIIERQTQHIHHLADDLMDITRINQGKIPLHLEPMPIRSAICLALESCEEALKNKHHRLVLNLPEEPIFILGDITRVAQIMINIFGNAIKYTPANGKITISVGKTETEAHIKVQDTGIGIPPEMLDRAFEMFRRVENNSSLSVDGLGVGLGIAKKLAEMHGGKITPANTSEAGCEFIISFPRIADPAPAAETENHPAPNDTVSGKRILIIDDNCDAARVFEKLLSMEGYNVRTATDGETGIEIAFQFQPDVCLCDIGLPHMNGYQVAEYLKETMPEMLLIALTGWGRPEDVSHARETGFNHHVVKSTCIDEILTLVKENAKN